jgi:hypothetical protein
MFRAKLLLCGSMANKAKAAIAYRAAWYVCFSVRCRNVECSRLAHSGGSVGNRGVKREDYLMLRREQFLSSINVIHYSYRRGCRVALKSKLNSVGNGRIGILPN